jgi:divalent metal cation (Fe/Co/Zn/Cd) transporter
MKSGEVSMSSGQGSPVKAILYAFLANSGIAVAKWAAALYTSSGSMMAEAIHSLADAGNQVFVVYRPQRCEATS